MGAHEPLRHHRRKSAADGCSECARRDRGLDVRRQFPAAARVSRAGHERFLYRNLRGEQRSHAQRRHDNRAPGIRGHGAASVGLGAAARLLLVTDITGTFCQDFDAQINNLIVNLYYVDQSSSQPGVPSLRRKALTAGPGPAFQPIFPVPDEELVSGVEDLQVQYGVDLSGGGATSGAASEYLDAGATLTNLLTTATPPAQNPAQIVAVRIWILVRSDSPESGFIDDHTYEYGDRLTKNGTTGDLTNVADNAKAYQPSLSADNSFTGVKRYRRLLVSKTIQIRNALIN
ncbi:MAG: hypothetical protein E6K32_09880 [Gammaproteobacteria bacterium]|nr:MAG: hypothetical protein E6K32_09880 [Gammaproteobacteria bacterium]